MQKSIRIYGASDDLIEIDGDRDLRDEHSAYGDDPSFVELSTGDVFRVQYGDPADPDRAAWSVEHHVDAGACEVRIDRAPPGDDPDPCTDVAHVTGPIEWVDVWASWPPDKAELAETLDRVVEDDEHRALSIEQLRQIVDIIRGRS